MKLIDKILTEWAYRVYDGMPNINNPLHIVHLRETMQDLKLPNSFIVEYMGKLFEDDEEEKPLDPKEKEKVKTLGLVWKGYAGGYGKEGKENPVTHKNKGGKLVPVADKEKTGEKTDGEETGVGDRLDGDDFKSEYEKGDEKEKEEKKELEYTDRHGNVFKGKKALRKENNRLAENQLKMYTGDPSEAGGLGTAQSRTGETVTVYGVTRIKEIIEELGKMKPRPITGDAAYQVAKKRFRKELEDHLKTTGTVKGKRAKPLLTQEWIDAGIACIDWIEANYGLENIDDSTWDNGVGRALAGTDGHGTSSDMFITLKNGQKIGVSLKKNFLVFVSSGGYNTQVKKLADQMEVELPDNATYEWYENQRTDVFADGIAKLNEDPIRDKVCDDWNNAVADRQDDGGSVPKNQGEGTQKLFGWRSSYKRLQQVAAAKQDISLDNFKKLSDEEQGSFIGNTTCDDLYDHVINDPDAAAGWGMRIIGAFAQTNEEINTATNEFYKKYRNLDGDLMDNLYDFIVPKNETKFKNLVMDNTHINDILFGTEKGVLDKLEVVYGELPAGQAMKPGRVAKLFGIDKEWNKYKNMADDSTIMYPPKPGEPAEKLTKEQYKQALQAEIHDKMVIKRIEGKPVIGVKVIDEKTKQESVSPIYSLGARSKGIGSAPTLEMAQKAFGSLAFKNGNIKIDTWPDEDRKKYVDELVAGMKHDFEEGFFELEDMSQKQELLDELDRLEKLWGNTGGKNSISTLRKKIEKAGKV
jgi:hypothetical protein